MNEKEHRQRLIVEIIERQTITTQAELVSRLGELRVQATQATVSRDITELRLVRIPTEQKKFKYAIAPYANPKDIFLDIKEVFAKFVRDIDRAENIVVIKTNDGRAERVANLLEHWGKDEIVGTLFSGNTVMLILRNTTKAKETETVLAELLL